MTDNATPDIDGLTEDEALNLFHRLRTRFDWSGTVFVRQDVVDAVRTATSDDQDEGRALAREEDEVVDAVMGSYTYRKLGDRFAELGNELLADAARAALRGDNDL